MHTVWNKPVDHEAVSPFTSSLAKEYDVIARSGKHGLPRLGKITTPTGATYVMSGDIVVDGPAGTCVERGKFLVGTEI